MEKSPEASRFGKVADDLIASLRRIPSENQGRGRPRPARQMSELIEALQMKHGIGKSTPEQAIREAWPEVVGQANAAYSNAVRIDRGGRLVVHASHPVVRNELFLNREEILQRIQKIPGCGMVKLVHFATA